MEDDKNIGGLQLTVATTSVRGKKVHVDVIIAGLSLRFEFASTVRRLPDCPPLSNSQHLLDHKLEAHCEVDRLCGHYLNPPHLLGTLEIVLKLHLDCRRLTVDLGLSVRRIPLEWNKPSPPSIPEKDAATYKGRCRDTKAYLVIWRFTALRPLTVGNKLHVLRPGTKARLLERLDLGLIYGRSCWTLWCRDNVAGVAQFSKILLFVLGTRGY